MDILKVMVIVGTRPEIIKLSEIIKKIDKYFCLILIHTGQNYDPQLSDIFFDELGIREPDKYLNVAGNNVGETIGNVINKSYKVMLQYQPDAVLVLGDTNSCLSVIAAKRLKIPIFHMEAGNRCFDENLPEEVNRRIIDHVSDINLCYTEHARRYLFAEGIRKETIFVTGSPMAEVLNNNIGNIEKSLVLKKMGLEAGKYILLSAHREENMDIEKNFLSLMEAVNVLAEHYNLPIIYSCHPRSSKILKERNFKLHNNIKKHKPMGFFDYNALQLNSMAVLSDSGTLAEESSFYQSIGKPLAAVSIRTSTERPEAVEKGNMIVAGIGKKEIMQATSLAVRMKKNNDNGNNVPDYLEDVSSKVIRIIQSYTGLVDRTIWKKL